MKVIFLDIDWVLHWLSSWEDFIQKNINQIHYILNKTWAQIVITSDRRCDLPKLKAIWNELTLPDFIWTTHLLKFNWWMDLERIREKEIKHYLKTHKEITSFCVLDDMILNLPNFIKCNPQIWITRIEAEKAITILLNEKW